ncbi:AMP-binding protein [Nonomuraea sp. NPDC050540]|uniref:AMP-binding protein n=1 Tax=Nonomuraea sp. NPDC050540 TaxID=3364367 RepID=UPI0037BDA827
MTAKLPPREQCVLPLLLRDRARQEPDRPFVAFADGTAWTYGDAWDETLSAASGLRSLGVEPGDHVLVWLPNGPEILRAWFGANQLGAVFVPVNTAYRGDILAHVLTLVRPKVVVVHADLADRLAGLDLAGVEHVVVAGGPCAPLPGVAAHGVAVLHPAELEEPEECPAQPWDPYAVIFTSGTTGPSKGVISSYVHLWATVTAVEEHLSADDRCLTSLPIFHGGGLQDIAGALIVGASVVLVESFDTSSFWDVIERTGATCCTLLGVMATFLLKQPPRPGERDTTLRLVYLVPLTDNAGEFARRFGCDILTVFNMTEVSVPLVSELNPATPGSCGRPRPGVQVRVVDAHDQEVPQGEIGELVIRTDLPWAMTSGYLGAPEATAAAWRNGWFHTGDAFRRDEHGDHFFVDRIKDAIRRRGENISSSEVEAEILRHPAVREAAAVAVPSGDGEDDVLAAVAPVDGARLDPRDLLEFLVERLPHFMVPRYVRVLGELPKTPTSKIEKRRLRREGVTPDTWDREAAGLKVRRTRLKQV